MEVCPICKSQVIEYRGLNNRDAYDCPGCNVLWVWNPTEGGWDSHEKEQDHE
jgi:hypothetical protein